MRLRLMSPLAMMANICFSLPARDFKPTFAEDEFENVYVDMQRIYLVTLAKDTEAAAWSAE